jgi:hypothetical protein
VVVVSSPVCSVVVVASVVVVRRGELVVVASSSSGEVVDDVEAEVVGEVLSVDEVEVGESLVVGLSILSESCSGEAV